jgi:hypothetical protein
MMNLEYNHPLLTTQPVAEISDGMMVGTQLISPAIGQICALRETPAVEEEALQPPHVDYGSAPASLLHWGMSAADVEWIMGPPALASSVSSNRGDLRVPDISFGTFTFVDGVLTAFADGGSTPLSEVINDQ